MTTVYGPTNDSQKPLFLHELNQLRQAKVGLPWLVCGDFNMIYQAVDKNNNRLNRRLMGQFRRFLSEGNLREIHLQGRLFTWSNERAHPTLERIDRAFISNEWDTLHPDCNLQSLSPSCLDHTPLLLRTDASFFTHKMCHFRSFWPKFPGFMQVIERAWHCLMHNANPFRKLAWLLRNTTRCLQSWSTKIIGNVWVQLSLASEVVHRLEITHDRRPLAPQEDALRQFLKLKSLGLASLQHTIARQESRILWLMEGDALTRFFHIQASQHHQKNFIHALEHHGQWLVAEDRKVDAAFEFFNDILGAPAVRESRINLGCLDLPRHDLSSLCDRFMEEEVWATIRSLPPDKAPRTDGFTSRFLQVAWPVIRKDLMSAFDTFWHLDMRSFHMVNDNIITLIPKNPGAVALKDFHPISLIHLVGKLFSKVLSTRLAPRLSSLIHPSQSAFIKGRVIQDNFRYVHSAAKLLHARKKSSLLLKVDISRAFDSVAWPFLLEVM
jgi:hypothetical protein